jgi:hypothetical protein
VAIGQQALRQVKPDEASRAGNKKAHEPYRGSQLGLLAEHLNRPILAHKKNAVREAQRK